MQPPSDGSYGGPQGPNDPHGQPPSDGEPNYGYPEGQSPGHQPQGGSYPGGYGYAPATRPSSTRPSSTRPSSTRPSSTRPQQYPPQQGYQPGGYPQGPGYGYQPPPARRVTSRGWFWVTVAAVVVIAAAVISTLVVTGGGGSTPVGQRSGGPGVATDTPSDTSAPSDTSPSDTSPSDTSPSGSTSVPTTTTSGDIGRTFTVTGQEAGEKLALTLVAVDQAARSTDTYEKPGAGMHYVATELRVRNVGSAPYEDDVNNCIAAFDNQNSKYSISYVEDITSGKVFDEVTLSPGQSAQGWSVYAVPTGKTDLVSHVHRRTRVSSTGSTAPWKVG